MPNYRGTSLKVAGGKGDIRILKASVAKDWADMLGTPLGTNTHLTQTVTVVGAQLGDFAIACMSNVSSFGAALVAHVTATDTVTVTALNASAASINMAANGILTVMVIKV